MNKNLIIVFVRTPELGKVKTRLAKSIGDVSALTIYKLLLKHTATVLHDLSFCNGGNRQKIMMAVCWALVVMKQDWFSRLYENEAQ